MAHTKVIPKISVHAALSKMDSHSYPLVDLYCEDDVAAKIIVKAIKELNSDKKLNNFQQLINVIISGSASTTYEDFKSHERTYKLKKVRSGYGCILDGDQRLTKPFVGDKNVHFLYSNHCPEQFLVRAYLTLHPHTQLSYHASQSDPHCLFSKMIELGLCFNKDDAFESCFSVFRKTADGEQYFRDLKKYLFDTAVAFSPDL
jgi:hypothetical protein